MPDPTRLVYNRVAKAGSTSMLRLLQLLGSQNGFTVFMSPKFFLDERAMADDMEHYTRKQAATGAAYANHAGTVGRLDDARWSWINMVRDPLHLERSMHEYTRGMTGHSPQGNSLSSRTIAIARDDPACGCASLPFDRCLHVRAELNCSMPMATQRFYFCSASVLNRYFLSHFAANQSFLTAGWVPRRVAGAACASGAAGVLCPGHVEHVCSARDAAQQMQRYRFVGLTEEFETSVAMLERSLPRFFSNASGLLSRVGHQNTGASGAAPSRQNASEDAVMRRLLSRLTRGEYDEEEAFYRAVQTEFWRQVGAAGLDHRKTLP